MARAAATYGAAVDLAGRELELDAIAGPILRALPGAAPATLEAVRSVLGAEAAKAR